MSLSKKDERQYTLHKEEVREIYDYKEFRAYLESIDAPKPFGCPHLRVLQEAVFSRESGQTYEEGSLLCTEKPGTIGGGGPHNHRCGVKGDLIMKEDGSFEISCSWNGTKLRISKKLSEVEVVK